MLLKIGYLNARRTLLHWTSSCKCIYAFFFSMINYNQRIFNYSIDIYHDVDSLSI